jgi:quercetin dioxygenase-like cupin family protein
MSNRNDTSTSIIKQVLFKIKTATKPVIETLHRNEDLQVTMLGLNSGVSLSDHRTKVPAKLTVLSGSVIYNDVDGMTSLLRGDELAIPMNVKHSVQATRRSICLLTRGAG